MNGYALKRVEIYFQLCSMVLGPTKLKNVYAFVLSVCPPICACSNSRKYSSNVFKLVCAIHTWYKMECTENDVRGTNKHIKVFQYILAYGGKSLWSLF